MGNEVSIAKLSNNNLRILTTSKPTSNNPIYQRDYNYNNWNNNAISISANQYISPNIVVNGSRSFLAFGELGFNTGGGQIRVYSPDLTTNNNNFLTVTNQLAGAMGNLMGTAISACFSSDGSYCIAGSEPGFSTTGRVRVFRYNASGGSWPRIGTDIVSNQDNVMGSSLSMCLFLSELHLAIGESGHNTNRGRVRVFKYSGSIYSNTTSWTQVGLIIYGEVLSTDQTGNSVSLCVYNSTLILAVGEPGYNNNQGRVRVFYLLDETWTTLGSEILGETTSETGFSLSLIVDKNSVLNLAVGEPGFNNNQGRVRVFRYIERKKNNTRLSGFFSRL
jgi:hypothetical protein